MANMAKTDDRTVEKCEAYRAIQAMGRVPKTAFRVLKPEADGKYHIPPGEIICRLPKAVKGVTVGDGNIICPRDKVYKANMNYQRHIKNIHKDIWGDGLKAPNCLLAPAVMGRKSLDRIEDGIKYFTRMHTDIVRHNTLLSDATSGALLAAAAASARELGIAMNIKQEETTEEVEMVPGTPYTIRSDDEEPTLPPLPAPTADELEPGFWDEGPSSGLFVSQGDAAEGDNHPESSGEGKANQERANDGNDNINASQLYPDGDDNADNGGMSGEDDNSGEGNNSGDGNNFGHNDDPGDDDSDMSDTSDEGDSSDDDDDKTGGDPPTAKKLLRTGKFTSYKETITEDIIDGVYTYRKEVKIGCPSMQNTKGARVPQGTITELGSDVESHPVAQDKGEKDSDYQESSASESNEASDEASDEASNVDMEDADVISCICGATSENEKRDEVWIECEDCGVWQHNICMGVSIKPIDLKNVNYYCQICRPALHKHMSVLVQTPQKPTPQKRLAARLADRAAAKARAEAALAARASDDVACSEHFVDGVADNEAEPEAEEAPDAEAIEDITDVNGAMSVSRIESAQSAIGTDGAANAVDEDEVMRSDVYDLNNMGDGRLTRSAKRKRDSMSSQAGLASNDIWKSTVLRNHDGQTPSKKPNVAAEQHKSSAESSREPQPLQEDVEMTDQAAI